MNTLIIHPKDESTDFLNVIYKDIDCTLVDTDVSDEQLRLLIKNHDRIVMLGHGFPMGLYGHGKLVINGSHADILRGKNLVGIWCYANKFFESNNLLGIYSDMIISEPLEAIFLGVNYTDAYIKESNEQFADAVRDAIASDEPVQTFKSKYRSDSNPVINWNQDNFYHAYNVISI